MASIKFDDLPRTIRLDRKHTHKNTFTWTVIICFSFVLFQPPKNILYLRKEEIK